MKTSTRSEFVFAAPPDPVFRGGILLNERVLMKWRGIAQLAGAHPPQRCTLTTVYYAEGARNAWHGNASGGAYAESFAFDFESTAGFVASARLQGTSWVIKKRPACVFSTRNVALLTTGEPPVVLGSDSQPRRSLVELDRSSLVTMAESLRKRRGYRLFVTGSDFPPADGKRAAFLPASRGLVTGEWIEVARDANTGEEDAIAWQDCLWLRDYFDASS